MNLTTIQRRLIPLTFFLVWTGTAWGYLVGPSLSLEELTNEAGTIFKGTVMSTTEVVDDWFKPYPGFVPHETTFKVISILKGESPGNQLAFRHYDENSHPQGRMFQPQYYHFESGRTYIVFANKVEGTGFFRQIWTYHRSKIDQGVLLCADEKPLTVKTVKDAFWLELMGMLNSHESDILYAIQQLDEMSSSQEHFGPLSDFDRKDVVSAVHGFLNSPDSRISQAAISLIGTHNPFMTEERSLYWLASVGGGEFPGISKMDPKMKNIGGEMYWRDMIHLADSNAPKEIRSLAIRALGLVLEGALEEHIDCWLADQDPDIRASAVLLLSDFPGPETNRRILLLTGDPSSKVRVNLAQAIGFGQMKEMADILTKLLADGDSSVRKAAAMSLLSFSPKDETFCSIFRANIENREFKPLFLNALASVNPAQYLDSLAQVVEENTEPENFWGGKIPSFASWEILFKYLQDQPFQEIRSGRFDTYLDAIEKVGNYSSSEPRDIYAFYVQRGMTERAKNYRELATKSLPFNMDEYFNQVDKNPSMYKRE